MKTIVDRFGELRKHVGLTQKEFGRRLFVSASYISMLERGKETPSESFIKLAALEFGVSYDWLRNGIGDISNPTEKEIVLKELRSATANLLLDITEKLSEKWGDDKEISNFFINIFVILTDISGLPDNKRIAFLDVFKKMVFEIHDMFACCKNADTEDEFQLDMTKTILDMKAEGFEDFAKSWAKILLP